MSKNLRGQNFLRAAVLANIILTQEVIAAPTLKEKQQKETLKGATFVKISNRDMTDPCSNSCNSGCTGTNSNCTNGGC